MKSKIIHQIFLLILVLIPAVGKSQDKLQDHCIENKEFKNEFFKNIKIVDSLIYQIQNQDFRDALLFISKYSHVSAESMLNYARTYPGGIYDNDRQLWIQWYNENQCKNIQFKKTGREIYFIDGVPHDKLFHQVYTGTAQFFSKKGNLQFEEVYTYGVLIKTLLYYHIDSQEIISDEIFYNPTTHQKTKHLRYSSDRTKSWETLFDDREKKSEMNVFENKKLILHEEYLNGKKNGQWFCYNKEGKKIETQYSDGQKIKD